MKTKLILLLLSMFVVLSACQDDESVEITDVNFAQPEFVIQGVGVTKQLELQVTPSNVVRWSSVNPDVATVDATGLVKAVGLGRTEVIASTSGNADTCAVQVVDQNVVCLGMWEALAETYRFEDGKTYYIEGLIEKYAKDLSNKIKNGTAKVGLILPLENVEYYLFNECKCLTSIELPCADSVGFGAFRLCSSLKSAIAPKARMVENESFYNCFDLLEVKLPKAVIIGAHAFSGCESLYSTSLPEATTIGGSAFGNNCLSTIDLPKVTFIYGGAFRYCLCGKLKLGAPGEIKTDKDWAFNFETTICDLFLGAVEFEKASGNMWKGLEWRSISRY